MTDGYLRGRLLVATPSLGDPNFSHTVVLILDHGADGAVGVVLNRPSQVPVTTILPEWTVPAVEPPVVFVGGPVQREAVIALGRTDEAAGGQPVSPGVAVVDLTQAAERGLGIRVFAGYGGWGAGQIDAEIDAGGWFVVDAQPDDAFTRRPGALWLTVLSRQGGLFTTIPEDPTLN